jgi:hypothetical protein
MRGDNRLMAGVSADLLYPIVWISLLTLLILIQPACLDQLALGPNQ